MSERGDGDLAGGREALGGGVENFGGGERADEPRVCDRGAGAVVHVLGVPSDRDAGGTRHTVDGVERLHDVDERLQGDEDFVGGGWIDGETARSVSVE